jgi:signal transduction histidine kinase
MRSSWHDLLRTLDPAAFANVIVQRRQQPVPPSSDQLSEASPQTAMHEASIDPLTLMCAALSEIPHACAVVSDDGFVVHAMGTPAWAARDRGWVTGARLYEPGALREELHAGHPIVAVGDESEELLVPIAARGTPVFGVLALACNPAQLGYMGAVAVLQAAQAAAYATQLAELRSHNERLVGAVGHELRQPLSALVTALDLVGRLSPGIAVNPFRIAQRQTRQLMQLVDALLDASRITAGKLGVARRLIDVRGVVEGGVEIVRADVAEKHQQLAVDLPERPVWCLGDPARLQQVVVNLVTNACRYTPVGGEISLALHTDTDRVRLIVSDTGRGLEAEERERIFQPFTHVSSSPGLGLGLTISRAIAQLHGGTLAAESEGRNRGSRFVLELPGVMERTREVRDAVNRTREETKQIIERARVLRASLTKSE